MPVPVPTPASKVTLPVLVPRRFNCDEVPSDNPILLEALNSATCRWPLGSMQDRPPYMFCGMAVVHYDDAEETNRTPYCAGHYRISLDRVLTERTRITPYTPIRKERR